MFPLLDQLNKPNSKLLSYYSITENIDECNYIIIPFSIEILLIHGQKKSLDSILQLSQTSNKQVLLFSGADYGVTIKSKNFITVRLGGFASKLNDKTFIMPPFVKDPYVFIDKKISYLNKSDKVSIGFVGNSDSGFVKFSKEFVLFLKSNFLRIIKKDATDFQKFYPSSYFRHKYLLMLQSNKLIVTNFVFRKKYRAGAKTEKDILKTSLEFYHNIFENQYTFCLRGAGNFSVRFYETLALGRIPILINTDCKLPFENQINWKKHCLIIEENDVKNMSDKIINFHYSFSNNDFIEIQKSNRLLWENYFTKENYFIKLHNNLINS